MDKACPSCRKQGRDSTGNHLFLMEDKKSWYCNRCGYFETSETAIEPDEIEESYPTNKKSLEDAMQLPFRKAYRGIPAFVSELFGVRMECNPSDGEISKSFYPVHKKGEITAFKTRGHPKDFSSFPKGGMKGNTELFGYGSVSNTLIITGGEEDAMAAYTMLSETNNNAKYDVAVRSVVHGEQAVKDITNNLAFIHRFKKVILCLDNDGKTKEREMAAVIGSSVHIMSFKCKDANDMLLQGKEREFIDSFWKAKAYKPEELIWASDIMDDVYTEDVRSPIRYPFRILDEMLEGIRTQEMVSIIAGTGVGKSTTIHHILLHILRTTDWGIGTLCLEESPKKTLRNMLKASGGVDREEFEATVSDKLLLLDCFGSNSIEAVEKTIRYMAGTGLKLIILDHVSMMVADAQDDERRTLDKIMVVLRTLVQELDIHLIVVAHLRRSQGDQGYEDGKQVSLSAIRSSASIGQLSDAVVAIERSVSDDDEEKKSLVQLRILKNRHGSKTGLAGTLKYEDGQLKELLIQE